MPVRRRTQLAGSGLSDKDAVSAFRWSGGDGCNHMLGKPAFASRRDTERAWQRVRRLVWANTHRFPIPDTAETYDGLSFAGIEYLQRHWNAERFELADALGAIEEDRRNLERFRKTPGAATIADFLALLRTDLDAVEELAREMAAVPIGQWRPCPYNRLHSGTYEGTKQS